MNATRSSPDARAMIMKSRDSGCEALRADRFHSSAQLEFGLFVAPGADYGAT